MGGVSGCGRSCNKREWAGLHKRGSVGGRGEEMRALWVGLTRVCWAGLVKEWAGSGRGTHMRWASLGSGRGTWVRLRRPQLTVRPEHVHSAGHTPWPSPWPLVDTRRTTRAPTTHRQGKDMAGLWLRPDSASVTFTGRCLRPSVSSPLRHARRWNDNTRHHPHMREN